MPEETLLRFDDGLPCPYVGRWTETKYRLFGLYAALFSTGMKYKWDERIYIDLYSSAGYSRIRGTDRIIAGSPILALTVTDLFDKYIFCDASAELLDALRVRARRIAPQVAPSYIEGDCNSRIDDILSEIPVATAAHTVLGLCFVDPFDIGIKFETLRKLSTRYVDFLCLLAVYMDANRNYARYTSDESQKLDEFLGSTHWRDDWSTAQLAGREFPKFLAEQFSVSMQALGYIPQPLYNMKEVRYAETNMPLYYLALFSRHQRAYQFWADVLKYGTDQLSMEF